MLVVRQKRVIARRRNGRKENGMAQRKKVPIKKSWVPLERLLVSLLCGY